MKERYAIDHLREAEIGHLDDRRSIICEQDVVGLQITMSYAHFVDVLKPRS